MGVRLLLIDLHCHTLQRSPCSQADEDELIRNAMDYGLDGLVITDHGQFVPPGRLLALNEKYAPFRVFTGIEVTIGTSRGVLDFLVIGIHDPNVKVAWPSWSDEQIERVVQDGGAPPPSAYAQDEVVSGDPRRRSRRAFGGPPSETTSPPVYQRSTGENGGGAAPPPSGGWPWLYRDYLSFVRARHGFVILAHPFRYDPKLPEEVLRYPPDAVELHSTNIPDTDAPRIMALAASWNCPVVAASDAHNSRAVGCHAIRLSAPVQTDRELVGALRKSAFRLQARQRR